MNDIYDDCSSHTLSMLKVASEMTIAPRGIAVSAEPSVKQLRVRALAAALALALATVASPVWSQTCTPGATTLCGASGGDGQSNGDGGAGSVSSGTYANGGGSSGVSGSGGASPGRNGQGANGSGGAGGFSPSDAGGGLGGGPDSHGYGGGGGGGQSAAAGGSGAGGGGGGGVGQSVNGGPFANPGTVSGGNGGNGGNFPGDPNGHTVGQGGGGGGGGGAGIYASTGSTLTNSSGTTITGGSGGAGGSTVAPRGVPGMGGGGGSGVSGIGFSLDNAGSITGGAGGAGVDVGGAGGAGISIAGNDSSIVNTGTVMGGVGGTASTPGNGGAGVLISGNNNRLVTGGQIGGGMNGSGTSAAPAVNITGGSNTLELDSGYSFVGNVIAAAGRGNVLALGGNTNDSFDVSNIGREFEGFDTYAKSGASIWTLTGVNTSVTPWSINGGTLAISDDAALGNNEGALTLNGGALRTTADVTSSRNVALGASGGSIEVGSGTTATFGGVISDDIAGAAGSLALSGAGKLVLTADESYTGKTTIGNGTLALSGNGSIASSSSVIDNGTFDISATNNGASIKSLDGSGNVNLGAQALTLSAAADTFAGVIAGSGGLTVGGGTEVLTGANTYTGGTTISAGTLKLGHGGAAGSLDGSIANSSHVIDNGTFDISATNNGASIKSLDGSGNVNLGAKTLTLSAATGTFAGVIGGSGGLTVGSGTEVLTGANTYTGDTTISAGTLKLGHDGGAGSLDGSIANSSHVIDNGTFDINATNNGALIKSLGGNGNVNLGAQTLTLSAAADTFAGVIAGSGGLTVGGGTEVLTGANTYTGDTTIGAGTLKLGHGAGSGSRDGSIANSSHVIDNGTFDISATNNGASITSLEGSGNVNLGAQVLTLSAAAGTFNGVIAGNGGLTVGSGTEVLTGANTYTGDTTISAGILKLGSGSLDGSIANSSHVIDNGTFDISATNNGTSIKSLGGSGNVNMGAQSLTLSAAADTFAGVIAGSGGLTVGGGTEELTGANIYTGDTTISAGTLKLGHGGGSGSVDGSIANSSHVIDNGTFDISATNNGASIKSLDGSGNVNLGAQTLTLSAAAGTFAGVIAGGGGLTVGSGTEILTGANTYTGDTTISAGTLKLGRGAGSGSLDGSIANSSHVIDNGTFDISTTNNGTSIKSLGGSGNVNMGAQSLTLSAAADTFAGVIAGSGGLTVGGGTEELTGANIYTGDTTIGAGTLKLGHGGGAGSLDGSIANSSHVTDNGTFDISDTNNGASIKSLDGSGHVNLGSQTLTLSAAAGTFAGAISGAGRLVLEAGKQVLTGANTYAGLTEVQGGTLLIGGDATASSASIQSNAQVDTGANLGGFGTVAGNLDVAAGAHLSPGNVNALGTLSVGGNLTLGQGSILDFAFGAPGATYTRFGAPRAMHASLGAPGATYTSFGAGDSVKVDGNLALNGTVLNVRDAGGFGAGLYNLFTYNGMPTESNGGISLGEVPANSNLVIQNLTGDKQVNLVNAGSEILTFWNANGLASPTRMGGGSGTWSATSPNWTDAGGSVTASMNPQPGFAIFGGAAGTVTIDHSAGNVSATGMQFAKSGYELTGDTLTLAAGADGKAPVIRVGDGTTASATDVATISNAVTGTDGLVKSDYGTLVLAGKATITGGSAVNGGELDLRGDGSTFSGGFTMATDSALLVGRAATGVSVIGAGGNGNAGGAGVSGSGFGLTNNSRIAGGNGSAGGAGVSGSSFTLVNHGSIVGGDGGIGSVAGAAASASVPDGAGGAGLVSTGHSIVVSTGSIAGGLGADGTQADAVDFSGGNNTLELNSGYAFTGDVVSTSGATQGGDTLALGGSIDDGFDVSKIGAVGGTAEYRGFTNFAKSGSSTWTLTGVGNASEAWKIMDGTLVGNTTSLVGNVIFAPATAATAAVNFNQTDAGAYVGTLSGDGSLVKTGGATLTLTAANTYTGGTALDAGKLMLGNALSIGSGTLAMAQGTTLDFAGSFTLANAIRLSGDPTVNVDAGLRTTLSGSISDGTQPGDLVKTGAGTLVLTGTNTYTGSTEATAGTLDVEGSLASAVSVASGATLIGNGSTGGLMVEAGGTVSPGGAGTLGTLGAGTLGTLTVNGNVSMAAGSTYRLDVNDAGSSDLIRATGTAQLGGGSVVSAEAGSHWNAATTYTILTAGSGVSGTFGAVSSNFAFLTPTLSYDANHAYLTLVRNAVAFPTVGVTSNEIHTGSAIEALGVGNAVYNAVLPQAAGPARAAFAELAGDSLASTRTAIVDDSRYVRDAIDNHLQGVKGRGETNQADDQGSVWASVWRHGGNNDSDGNAAGMVSNGSGLLVGADHNIESWRVGAVVGSGQLSNNTIHGLSDAHSTNKTVGLYTGVDLGPWQFHGGAAHSWYDTRSHRQIDVSGLEGHVTARYRTGITQAYVDGGYQLTFRQGSMTPYADVARVWLHENAINEESTGAAALKVHASGTAVNYGTLGLRGIYNPSAAVQLHASLGFQKAWGALRSIDQQRFGNGGTTSFAVAGLPVAKNSGVLDFGMQLHLSKSVSVDASYHGQFASRAKDQGARITLEMTL